MVRRVLLLLALLAFVAPPAVAGEPSESVTDCVDPLGVLPCATATMTITVRCFHPDPSRGQCDAAVHWDWSAGSPVVPGDATRSGSALVEFCPPGGLCRGFGVGLLIVTCSFNPLQPTCGTSFDYPLSTGAWTLGAGECLDATVSGFGDMTASPINGGVGSLGGGALRADALVTPVAEGSVCA